MGAAQLRRSIRGSNPAAAGLNLDTPPFHFLILALKNTSVVEEKQAALLAKVLKALQTCISKSLNAGFEMFSMHNSDKFNTLILAFNFKNTVLQWSLDKHEHL